MRDDFIGDEYISSVTGKLTRHAIMTQTYFFFLIGCITLIIIILICIALFVIYDILTNIYKDQVFIRMGVGVLYGVLMQIMNIVYAFLV